MNGVPEPLAAQSMLNLLTAPYRRGAETLAIPIGADNENGTAIGPYEFGEYRARYGAEPKEPCYVMSLRTPLGASALKLELDFSFQRGLHTTLFEFPARSRAGISFVIPLPGGADATLRFLRFRQKPLPLPGEGAENFGIVALLGNVSKLAWVLGWEKDQIRSVLREVREQRRRALAHGASLDKLGQDLRVLRFPPREHSFDANTLALYHLNEVVVVNGNPTVAEETKKFGLPGHPGTIAGSPSLVAGKFGNGFRFPGPGGNGAITVANAANFDVPANQSFTVEAFVNVDAAGDASPRVVLIKGPVNPAGTLTGSGWSLSIASFRGIANNVRWAVSDGALQIEAFADLNLADGRFHHLAGTLDRASRRMRLLVDGELCSDLDVSALGALTNSEIIRMGRSAGGHAFAGVIDEVRFSRIARSDFHPVLGEGDDAYRERLGIFERWLLPTPGALLDTINSTVRIDGETRSFVLIERNRPISTATKLIRIVPAALPAGQSIDRDGSSIGKEDEVCGLPEDDFNIAFLHPHDRPKVDYGSDPNRRLMQSVTKARLDALVDLLAVAASPTAGNLIVEKAFDPAGPGLHRVGRALLLHHQSRTNEQLAALAHRAGFDFVRNEGSRVYASVAPGEQLEIVIEPRPPAETPPSAIDLFVGKPIDLAVAPTPLPPTAQIKWTLILCGAARAHFAELPGDRARNPLASRPRVRLIADAPGALTLKVECVLARHVVSGTRTFRIGIESLADQQTISASGDVQISEATAVGAPAETVNPIYLITSNVAGVNYGSDPNNRKMQLSLEKRFNALLATQQGLANGLQVLKAFDPNDTGLHKAGRALLIAHSSIPSERLAALAHQAEFGFVRRQGAQVYCSVAPAERIEIAHAADLSPLLDELVAGVPVELRARFDPLPGVGSFNWSVGEAGRGRGSLDFILRPTVRFTPRDPGLASLNITYVEQDPTGVFPYSFEIRLKPELEARNAVIPKHQYDLIMNILNFFHPIGVEVLTGNIRKRVVEIEQNPLKAFPDYTYPDFRI